MNSSDIHVGSYLWNPSQEHGVPCCHLHIGFCSTWKCGDMQLTLSLFLLRRNHRNKAECLGSPLHFWSWEKWCWVWKSLLPRIPEKIKTVLWLDFLLSCLSAEHAVYRHKTKFHEFNCNITVKYMSKKVFESIYMLRLSSKSLCLGTPDTISLGASWSSALLWVSLDL